MLYDHSLHSKDVFLFLGLEGGFLALCHVCPLSQHPTIDRTCTGNDLFSWCYLKYGVKVTFELMNLSHVPLPTIFHPHLRDV
jgi:hypothetical protein